MWVAATVRKSSTTAMRNSRLPGDWNQSMKMRQCSLCMAVAAAMLLSSCGTTTSPELGLADGGKRAPSFQICLGTRDPPGHHGLSS